MKFVTYSLGSRRSIGALVDDGVVDISHCVKDGTADMIAFLASGETGLDRVRELLASDQCTHGLRQIRLESPVPRPGKYLAAGLNPTPLT